MNLGDRFSLALKHPHQIEATVLELTPHGAVCDVLHRCESGCYLREMEASLPIDGRRVIRYDELADRKRWLPMAQDAIPLPAAS